jgi:hypothetical protein
MRDVCDTVVGNEVFYSEYLEVKDHSGDQDADGRMVLNWI